MMAAGRGEIVFDMRRRPPPVHVPAPPPAPVSMRPPPAAAPPAPARPPRTQEANVAAAGLHAGQFDARETADEARDEAERRGGEAVDSARDSGERKRDFAHLGARIMRNLPENLWGSARDNLPYFDQGVNSVVNTPSNVWNFAADRLPYFDQGVDGVAHMPENMWNFAGDHIPHFHQGMKGVRNLPGFGMSLAREGAGDAANEARGAADAGLAKLPRPARRKFRKPF
jgi:hypothetical protein